MRKYRNASNAWGEMNCIEVDVNGKWVRASLNHHVFRKYGTFTTLGDALEHGRLHVDNDGNFYSSILKVKEDLVSNDEVAQ